MSSESEVEGNKVGPVIKPSFFEAGVGLNPFSSAVSALLENVVYSPAVIDVAKGLSGRL